MVAVFSIKKQIATKDNAHDAVNALQSDLIPVMSQLTSLVSSQMVLLTTVSLSTVAAAVAHNLGRECRGFIVADKTDTFDVYRDIVAANPDPSRFIMLRTSAGTRTVNLIVF